MGYRVPDMDQCPNCQSKNCYGEYDWSSGERCHFCSDCGYLYSWLRKRDEEGRWVRRNGAVWSGTEYDWEISLNKWEEFIYECKDIDQPYGVGVITPKKGWDQHHPLADGEEANKFSLWIHDLEKTDIQKVVISRFIDGNLQKAVLYHAEIQA